VGSRRDFEEMNSCITLAALRPVVESFSWHQVREVLKRMESGAHFGKLAVTLD
jgi:hypothetical protein